MNWGVVLVTLAMALVIWLVVSMAKSAKRVAPGRSDSGARSRDRYHAVTIRAPTAACVAASLLKGRRFLAAEAPAIPLAGCARRKCECTYGHFADRRHYDRRLGFVDARPRLLGTVPERRERSGRRKSDRSETLHLV